MYIYVLIVYGRGLKTFVSTELQDRLFQPSFGGTFFFSNCHIIGLYNGSLVFIVFGHVYLCINNLWCRGLKTFVSTNLQDRLERLHLLRQLPCYLLRIVVESAETAAIQV
jgi:hypothetical protein